MSTGQCSVFSIDDEMYNDDYDEDDVDDDSPRRARVDVELDTGKGELLEH